jgi:hypothetical protein
MKSQAILAREKTISILEMAIRECTTLEQYLQETTIDHRHADYNYSDIAFLKRVLEVVQGKSENQERVMSFPQWRQSFLKSYFLELMIKNVSDQGVVSREMNKISKERKNGKNN